ncbi:MAG: type IV pilus secretin PilQ [Acidobacteriia bacterium]|nr:type IV pilus secretin PilQ [Terriglobia bacterium]
MRRKVILSLTVMCLILGVVSLAQSRDPAALPQASLKAIGLTGPASSHQLLLRIEGDYAFSAVRTTPDVLLIDLAGVRAAGVTRDAKLTGDLFAGYHVLQYSDAKGKPVVRVQVNLKHPETVALHRDPAGLLLVSGEAAEPTSTPQIVASAPAAPALPKAEPVAKPALPSTAKPVRVSGVEVTTDASGATYVDIATTSAARYHVFRLSGPARLVVDLQEARNGIPRRAIPIRGSYLRGVRVGQFREADPAVVRVVADLAGEPAFDVHAQASGVRIELRPRKTTPPTTAPAVATPVAPPARAKELIAEKVTGPVPAAVPPPPLPSAEPKVQPEPASAATTPAPPIAQMPVRSSLDLRSVLPALTESPEVAAAPKPEPPAESPEAIQAARAAMTMAATAMPALGQAAGSAQEQPKYTGEPISLNLKDVDLKDFFRLIHEISGLNIIIDPNVSGSVTLVLDAVPWDQALDIVLKNNRLGKTLEGNVLRIARVETLTAEQEAARKLAEAREEAQPLVTVFRPVNYAKASTIATMIKSWAGGGALSKRGNILVDERTNTLIISDIQTQIPIVESIIVRLDKKAKQVQIEARIVLAKATFSRTLQSALTGAYVNRAGRTLIGGQTGTGAAVTPEVSIPSAPDIKVTSTTTTGFGAIAISNAGARYIINAAIAAEEDRGQAKTLSRPTIVTQNNVPGTVMQGTQVPVQTTINNTISVQYVNAALTMKVTPQVTEDGNIFLDINVTNASVGALLLTAGPSIDTQQATTQVLVPDGGTVVFGGVTVTSRTKTESYVPLLGSIPIIGHLFKNSNVSDNDQELLFFISPKVLPG